MFNDIFNLAEKEYTDEDAQWDAFVASHPNGSILQTTHWARLKGRFGWTGYRVWLKQDGQLVAGAQMLFRSAAMRLLKIGYVPHGPLVDWDDAEQVAVLFNQIDHAVYEHRAGMIKMEPLLWNDALPMWQRVCEQQELVADTDTIQPPRTMVLDLRPSEDEILGRMKQKTRYNIRLAARKGVTVREGALADVPIFNRMMQVTGSRNAFGIHEPEYYRTAFEIFSAENAAALFIAEYEGQPLAGVMVFRWGDKAGYLYGASTDEERQRMPTYAVQWAAIQWAKAQGCTTYDMWGVPDAPAETLEADFQDRNDGLWGVYRFKRGWGGDIVRTVGSADRVYNNLVYRLYKRRRGLA
jgi:lipid II:glycine glycyltransferase (peptidoglycan interpeptide bridge formation enzyme)